MDLKDYIESIPGFPKEGIIFRDVTPILQNAKAMRYCVDQLNAFVKEVGADIIVAPEARGFLFGVPVKLIAFARTNPSAYLFPSVHVAATGYFIPICAMCYSSIS